jgi:hypothetical protein
MGNVMNCHWIVGCQELPHLAGLLILKLQSTSPKNRQNNWLKKPHLSDIYIIHKLSYRSYNSIYNC